MKQYSGRVVGRSRAVSRGDGVVADQQRSASCSMDYAMYAMQVYYSTSYRNRISIVANQAHNQAVGRDGKEFKVEAISTIVWHRMGYWIM
jgi:hypothetical protein